MKKLLKKIFLGTSLTLVALIGFVIMFLLYPNNLFAKRTVYKNFEICSASELKGDYKTVLDNAIRLARASELFDDGYSYDILLTEGAFYRDFSFKLLGPAMARSLDNNIMLNAGVDFSRNLLASPNNKRDLTRTIAHEIVHCLQLNRYGFLKFNPLKHPPLWKLEGYPEYIAYRDDMAAPGYRFTETIEILKDHVAKKSAWVELKPGHSDPMIYFRGRVLIEYLVDVKGMSYDQVLNDEVREADVYKEMNDWYLSQIKN